MNSKQRLMTALNFGQPDIIPVAPHWWGDYKYEIADKNFWTDCWTDGLSIVPIYAAFYERFRPDWFHLSGGYLRQRRGYPARDYHTERKGERLFLVAPDGHRDEVLADETLASGKATPLSDIDLTSHRAIDDYLLEHEKITAEEIVAAGYTDHAAEIVRRYGDDVFIAVNVGTPGMLVYAGERGYVKSMLSLYDYPKGVKYLIQRRYELALEQVRAFSQVGVHGWIISEDRAGADTVSPEMYKQFLYEADCVFFAEVKKLGMIPIVYFCGDVMPLLSYIRESGVLGLMVEESRKTFHLDVVEIARKLQGKVCLFGNVNTTDLIFRGTPEEIELAVKLQISASKVGPFVMANGSPLVPGTPPENVEALITATHKWGQYPL